ncbi:MAG TPA: LysR family transcriptional regulator [Phenylobacterium sp.]|jgi:DNA-binding transcriptional LysR family regulator|uniref:LysR family transcriptional regulator n=1 Tax=Phenylobacterium sp. TaxID=1871053 RepID=UPI002D6D5D77|nr:LysR family transcriptional regulator [Phenylobacterium sp.]HZZ67424.1 LysR family transcriptional regulator [Phenylobacterium sp.]
MKASQIELEAVVSVARQGGFRAAARELGMASSALSHAVAALEARLGVRLFNRTTRSVALSPEGEQFVAEVAPALAAIQAALARVEEHQAEPSGVLRLNMAPGAARMILAPLVFEYMHLHPKVDVEVVTEGALVDVVGQGFDAGVRLAEFVPPDMIAVPITRTMRTLVVGSPAYFEGRPRPRTPQDLMGHRCIRARMASGAIYRWEFEKRGQSLEIDVPGDLTLDESDLMLQAALAGQGLAYLSDPATAEHLAARRLLSVLEDWSPAYPGLCLYFPSRHNIPARLRAFIELVRQQSR